jgi:type VI secretion system protein ImpM
MSALQTQQLCYFGKLPGRGDFVKGLYNPQLIKVFDNWLSQTMEMLSEDPRWKIIYDNAAPIHFVCLGSRSRVAITGHLKASRDESSAAIRSWRPRRWKSTRRSTSCAVRRC